jgi:hypothetical protein
MSLIAPLLVLPSRLRKLRQFNAPKILTNITPGVLTLAPGSTDSGNSIRLQDCNNFANKLRPIAKTFTKVVEGRNDAVVVSVPAVNLAGPGAVDGVWWAVRTNLSSTNPNDAPAFNFGVEVKIDGVDVVNPAYRISGRVSSSFGYMFFSSVIGSADVKHTGFYDRAPIGRVSAEFERASVPWPFKNSLEINVVHYETERSGAAIALTLWANAWQTE